MSHIVLSCSCSYDNFSDRKIWGAGVYWDLNAYPRSEGRPRFAPHAYPGETKEEKKTTRTFQVQLNFTRTPVKELSKNMPYTEAVSLPIPNGAVTCMPCLRVRFTVSYWYMVNTDTVELTASKRRKWGKP